MLSISQFQTHRSLLVLRIHSMVHFTSPIPVQGHYSTSWVQSTFKSRSSSGSSPSSFNQCPFHLAVQSTVQFQFHCLKYPVQSIRQFKFQFSQKVVISFSCIWQSVSVPFSQLVFIPFSVFKAKVIILYLPHFPKQTTP